MLLIATLALALSVAEPQAAAPPAPAPPGAAVSTDQLARAYDLFLQGLSDEGDNDAAAIASYRQALAILPADPTLHAHLAAIYARQGQTDDATSEARAALAADPANRDANRLLGWLQATAAARQPAGPAATALSDEAIGHLKQALAGGADDLSARLILAELYLRRHRGSDAVEELRRVIEQRPQYAPAERMLVEAYRITGDAAEAEKAMQALDNGVPDTVALRISQIERAERGGDWRSAASAWDDLIGSQVGARIYRPQQALALANSGQMPEAQALIREIVQDWPRDIGSWYLKAQIEARAGDYTAADAAALHIRTIDPADARGPLAVAAVRTAQGDRRAAIRALAPRVKNATDADVASGWYVQLAAELARAYSDSGDHKHAVETLEGAHARLPDDHGVLFALGTAYDENHQADRAEAAFRELIAASPTNAPALNYLGYMLADRGEKLSDAVDLIKRALAIDRDNPAYLDSLGWAYFKMGQFDDARSPLERAAAGLPKASVVQEHLGDLYLQIKRYADAAAAFDRALAGDRDSVDAGALTKKRDRARALAGQS